MHQDQYFPQLIGQNLVKHCIVCIPHTLLFHVYYKGSKSSHKYSLHYFHKRHCFLLLYLVIIIHNTFNLQSNCIRNGFQNLFLGSL